MRVHCAPRRHAQRSAWPGVLAELGSPSLQAPHGSGSLGGVQAQNRPRNGELEERSLGGGEHPGAGGVGWPAGTPADRAWGTVFGDSGHPMSPCLLGFAWLSGTPPICLGLCPSWSGPVTMPWPRLSPDLACPSGGAAPHPVVAPPPVSSAVIGSCHFPALPATEPRACS